jgi:hypothetical protein
MRGTDRPRCSGLFHTHFSALRIKLDIPVAELLWRTEFTERFFRVPGPACIAGRYMTPPQGSL